VSRAKLAAKIGAGATALAVPLVMLYEGYVPWVHRDPIGRLAACYGHDDQTMTPGIACQLHLQVAGYQSFLELFPHQYFIISFHVFIAEHGVVRIDGNQTGVHTFGGIGIVYQFSDDIVAYYF
jgi:hypothetical protein